MQDRAEGAPPLIAVTGFQDSGKTAAVEAIVGELRRRGYRVGTFKHCHDGYDIDRPGKDSWRHRQAGAVRTALTSPGGLALLGEPLPAEDLHSLAARLFPDVDLVLAEGYHWLPLPRIEIRNREGVARTGHSGGEILGRLPYGFGASEISEMCDLLERHYLSRGSDRE